jgi:hypothetical protein
MHDLRRGSHTPKDCHPDEFVVGGIIAKFPPLWRDFAISLKHKRLHMSISDLIAFLDVKEKAQAKDG